MSSPQPPYFAVIFTSLRNGRDDEGYAVTADRMVELAAQQSGFLGVESARSADGTGITVSYWRSLDDIRRWREHAEHRVAQERGRERWYRHFDLRIARVDRAWSFDSPA